MHVHEPLWIETRLAFMRLPLSQQLLRKAEAAERRARELENCMWMGDEHPMQAHLDDAAMYRQAAAVALRDENRRRPKDS